ncbi:hypothetical protein B0H14DRAFT_3516418 [Mycena olivaceomarginata]|nr:hypothetical protein B0H14DRAFT_3516418 [Mycena olivaceomarginata]
MPDVFVPPELAASFVAYMNAQGASLPPSFTELSSRLSAALATPTPTHTLVLITSPATRNIHTHASSSSTLSAANTRIFT